MFFVDRSARGTLQLQLASSICSLILDTQSAPGTRMPSTRKLSETLGISRLTVILVYQDLVAQGYLDALPRSGFVVSRQAPHRRIEASGEVERSMAIDWARWLPRNLMRRRRLTKPLDWRSYPYPFIYGQVDPKLFDHNAWRDCARRAMGTRDFPELADDRVSQDDPVLVEYIRRNTLPRRGIRAEPDEVLITLGAQNALWIAATLLARPDRLGVMEDPGFPDFAETLRFAGMPVHFVPAEKGGLDPSQIPDGAGLVFVTPSHNVPMGATMSRDRRHEVLRRANEQDFLIIEDDYETEIGFFEAPSPSLKSMDRTGRVIYVGSFSKSLFPGLRIGYMVGSAPFIHEARELRSLMLRHAPGHMQRVAGYFLALGHYDSHVVRLREIFRRRRLVLLDALAQTKLTVAGAAQHGGSSLWVKSPDGIDSAELAQRAAAEGVLIEPGQAFFAKPAAKCGYFRLGYSSIDEDRIKRGIAILQTLL